LTEVELLQRQDGPYSRFPTFYDKAIQDGAIPVDQDNYTTALDRLYDVRGLNNQHIEIKNTGANGLTYTIENAAKEVPDVNDLVDADFKTIVADVNVAAAMSAFNDLIDISPESTAIRIRIKRQSAGQDTILAGDVSFN